MPVRGDACLYRMSDLGDTEDTIPDAQKVEFTGLLNGANMLGGLPGSPTIPRLAPTAPDDRTSIVSITPEMGRIDTDNEQPFGEQNLRPDTGYHGTKYRLELLFNAMTGRALAIQRLRNWTYHDNASKPDFEHGLVGFRNDFMPEFDIHPTADMGYKILAFGPSLRTMHPTMISATLILWASGEPEDVWTDSDV